MKVKFLKNGWGEDKRPYRTDEVRIVSRVEGEALVEAGLATYFRPGEPDDGAAETTALTEKSAADKREEKKRAKAEQEQREQEAKKAAAAKQKPDTNPPAK